MKFCSYSYDDLILYLFHIYSNFFDVKGFDLNDRFTNNTEKVELSS